MKGLRTEKKNRNAHRGVEGAQGGIAETTTGGFFWANAFWDENRVSGILGNTPRVWEGGPGESDRLRKRPGEVV